MSGPSPSASKRSLSRDSMRSAAAASSLSIASSNRAASAQGGVESPVLPWFLRQTKTEIHTKFVELEWQQRDRLSSATSPPSQWARVAGESVTLRNRYLNVDPFANNRVQLKVPDGEDDYINASPIVLRTTKSGEAKNFIATQGPKDNTHGHIWRMIWHECVSPAVVIMLTQTHESGREKCHQYYPRSLESPHMVVNEHDEFGDNIVFDITLLSLNEDAQTRSTIRELDITDRASGEAKKVWHVLFSAWPDFSVPEGADKHALLNLIPLSLEKNADPASPRIVHCSAGVGRSGTFIALDHLLAELAEGSLDDVPDGKDPIEETVEALRTQRMMMVQGESQFLLLYETLREKWLDRWRERMGLPPVAATQASPTGDDDGGPEDAGLGAEAKRGGAAEPGEREPKVARLAMDPAAQQREDKIARLAAELEAELRHNAAAAELS